MRKLIFGFVLATLLIGCSELVMDKEEESMRKKETFVETPEQHAEALESLKEYLNFNFRETEWIQTIKGLSIQQTNKGDNLILIETHQKDDHVLSLMAFVIWAKSDSPIPINEVQYVHNGKVIQKASITATQ